MPPAALWLFPRISVKAQDGIVGVSEQELDFDIPCEESLPTQGVE